LTFKIIIMKKYLLLLFVFCISIGALAQKGKVTIALNFLDQNALDKAKEALEPALTNEKSKDWAKTFYAKGRICQASYQSDNPKFKTLYTNPLEQAYEAYEKAMALDPKGGTKKLLSLNSTYLALANDFINQGIQKYEVKDYEGALKSFDLNIKIATSDIYLGAIDTAVYFNAALAALNGKMYDKSIPYFQKCIDMKYKGVLPYLLMHQAYIAMKDMANAEGILKKVFEIYPDNQEVLLQLVDFYLRNDKMQEAFSYINLAKSKDPNNFSLYWAEGVLFMRQEKYDDAIADMLKSIELKSDHYDTQFNLGVCYYNKAVQMFQKANDIMDVAKYNAAVTEANVVFASAIPYFEKAHSLKPDEIDALKNLKELYYRLRTSKPEYEAKYNEIVKKLEGK
jgi:tetratricopeptide (TPR) repeat protein